MTMNVNCNASMLSKSITSINAHIYLKCTTHIVFFTRNASFSHDGPCEPPGEGCFCPTIIAPVCAVGGKTYDNICLGRCS